MTLPGNTPAFSTHDSTQSVGPPDASVSVPRTNAGAAELQRDQCATNSESDHALERPIPHKRRVARLLSALASRTEQQDLLFTSQALILCGLPYAPTNERTIIREAHTARGRVRVTFQAALENVPLAYGKDAVLLTFLTTKAILGDTPTVTFATAKEYFELFGEDVGGRSYRILAERWRRLAGLVIAVERHGDSSHETDLKVVIRRARLPHTAKVMAARAAFQAEAGAQACYSITLGTDFWDDLRRCAVPLLAPVMRAFANRPLAWHFVQYIHWRSFVALKAADHGRPIGARIDWADLRLMLGSATKYEAQLRRELRTVIADLKILWPQCNASFDGTTLCIGSPTSNILLVEPKERELARRAQLKWRRLIGRVHGR
jgi:hypothetical protein